MAVSEKSYRSVYEPLLRFYMVTPYLSTYVFYSYHIDAIDCLIDVLSHKSDKKRLRDARGHSHSDWPEEQNYDRYMHNWEK